MCAVSFAGCHSAPLFQVPGGKPLDGRAQGAVRPPTPDTHVRGPAPRGAFRAPSWESGEVAWRASEEDGAAGFRARLRPSPRAGQGEAWEEQVSCCARAHPVRTTCRDTQRPASWARRVTSPSAGGPASEPRPLSLQFLASRGCPHDCRKHKWTFLLPPPLVAQTCSKYMVGTEVPSDGSCCRLQVSQDPGKPQTRSRAPGRV